MHISTTILYVYFFFFSSRRRHTRSLRDWSSDVCSSDLGEAREVAAALDVELRLPRTRPRAHAPGTRGRARCRSEERRVGKECRSRGLSVHEKKKYEQRGDRVLIEVNKSQQCIANKRTSE